MAEVLPGKKPIYYDGGMGSLLMKNGMSPGMRSDEMNTLHPEVVEKIHRSYIEAGSELLCTNTFSLCSILHKMTDEQLQKSVCDAVSIARAAAGDKGMVGLDIGPTGEFMEPYGDLTYEEAYRRFQRMAVCGEKAGADYICIETMSAPDELKAAVLAAAENTKLGVLATMTFRASGLTITGASVEEFAELANTLPLLAAGLNCSEEPARMLPAAKRLAALLQKPLIIKLNAGLPDEHGTYSLSPEAYAGQLMAYMPLMPRIVGGCCGTTPDYIAAVKAAFENEREEI